MTSIAAKFHIGQIIHHRLFDYRGVIVDADPTFSGSETWYERVARSRPPKDEPWYRVLVDGGDHETYVAERNLEDDASGAPISHPLVERLFSGLQDGRYRTRTPHN
ncbi:MAG: heat shock protein HspQ [Thiohalocapsa sp.]|nr:heat shock protein HspQ [Thiohalocapsa sp.]MCF7992215.1 heat shock protein HspQ [Thiohalocapsa sp.]